MPLPLFRRRTRLPIHFAILPCRLVYITAVLTCSASDMGTNRLGLIESDVCVGLDRIRAKTMGLPLLPYLSNKFKLYKRMSGSSSGRTTNSKLFGRELNTSCRKTPPRTFIHLNSCPAFFGQVERFVVCRARPGC